MMIASKFMVRAFPFGFEEARLSRRYDKVGQPYFDQVFGYSDENVLHLEAVHQPLAGFITSVGADHSADCAQTAPTSSERPPDKQIQAPDSAPMIRRAISCIGTVRAGVEGSWSVTYSTIASSVKITTVIMDPMKANGVPSRCSHPRWAAPLAKAGAVNVRSPVTIPMPTARTTVFMWVPSRPSKSAGIGCRDCLWGRCFVD